MATESNSIQLTEGADGKILAVAIRGKLTKSDYEMLGPEMERLVQRHGMIRVVVEVIDFPGWTAGALWEDLKFDIKHFTDIERLAIVGKKAWKRGTDSFSMPFTKAQVRFFPTDERDDAYHWIARELPA